MGSDRSLITTRRPPTTVADPDGLVRWLRSLPAVDGEEAQAMVATLLARLARLADVTLTRDLPDEPNPAIDEMPEELVALETPGRLYESLMAPTDRRRGGAHYTPVGTARQLTQLACRHRSSAPQTVLDPAVGTASFLLGAATALEDGGRDRAEIVDGLWGVDLDPVALAIGETTLELWCGGRARPRLAVGDALVDEFPFPAAGFDLVVGNPPFLGQLTTDTARSDHRRHRLDARYGEAAAGYVDDAALFLVMAARRLRSDGVAVLLLPQSVLGSAHARSARAAVMEAARLAAVWIEADATFDAAVDVCAPVLVAGEEPTGLTEVVVGEDANGFATAAPSAGSWSPLLGASQGIPSHALVGHRTLTTVASATAGFRQHFYGLQGAVREDGEVTDLDGHPRLVTAGSIDPFRSRWGDRPIRFAGSRFERPVVDLNAVTDDSVRSWMSERLRPKVLVATQTRVVEAVVDETGTWLPSVPVIALESDELDPWMIAALVASPASCAHLCARAAGTGLSAGVIRLRARDLLDLPLPPDRAAWFRGAECVREAHAAGGASRWEGYEAAMCAYATAMTDAQGVDPSVERWWLDRLQFPR